MVQYEYGGGGVEEGCGGFEGGFYVFGQMVVLIDLSEELFDYLVLREDDEVGLFGDFVDYFDGDVGCFGDMVMVIVVIGLDFFDEWEEVV